MLVESEVVVKWLHEQIELSDRLEKTNQGVGDHDRASFHEGQSMGFRLVKFYLASLKTPGLK